MRILFLTHYFPPEVNAPATRTHEHCREWVAAGGHQGEHHDRRHQDDDDRGDEAPHDEREHRKFLPERSPATAAIPRPDVQPV